jgi:5-methyltetrahydrofolate--homocysteine methyltransferase
MVGLSGLLVKSAQQMVLTAGDLSRAGIEIPLLVGGAALTETFTDRQIAPAYPTGSTVYARDAMVGLDIAKRVLDPDRHHQLRQELAERRAWLAGSGLGVGTELKDEPLESFQRSKSVDVLAALPGTPDFETHVLIGKNPIDELWDFINPMMLFGRHLGLRGPVVRLLPKLDRDPELCVEIKKQDPKAFEIWSAVHEIRKRYRDDALLRTAAVYRFFRASSRGNSILFWDPAGVKMSGEIEFFRQTVPPHLCLADYVHPDVNAGDSVAIFVVTVGQNVREVAMELKNSGEYLRSHILQVLALESAEAYAERLHSSIRSMWGIADPSGMTMLDRFQAKYLGKRYSFGYPACPELGHQKILFDLLSPGRIGVELTEGFMMDPEASVSALVFHHPQCSYFSVGRGGLPK